MCLKMCYTYVNNMLCSAPAFIYFSIVHPIIHHHIVHAEVPEMDISRLSKMQNSKYTQLYISATSRITSPLPLYARHSGYLLLKCALFKGAKLWENITNNIKDITDKKYFNVCFKKHNG